MIRLAIVSPCYNEEEVLETSVNRLTQLYQQLIKEQKITEDSFFLFVNDGSKGQDLGHHLPPAQGKQICAWRESRP